MAEEEDIVVEAEELDGGVDGFGCKLGVAETAWWVCIVTWSVSGEGNGEGKGEGVWQRRLEEEEEGGRVLDLPGIMYVNDRRADSICETWLEFFVMKSS